MLPTLAQRDDAAQQNAMVAVWMALPDTHHFLLNKLLTGGFRIGVARGLVVKAVAAAAAPDPFRKERRLKLSFGGFAMAFTLFNCGVAQTFQWFRLGRNYIRWRDRYN